MLPKRVGRPSGWLVRFARDQVRLILALDETLCQGAFNPTTDAVPAGYETFRALWNSDETNQYGLVRLPDESDIIVTAPCRGQIPHYLVLPCRNEDEMRDPATYQRLMGIAMKTLLRGEEHKSSRHIRAYPAPSCPNFLSGELCRLRDDVRLLVRGSAAAVRLPGRTVLRGRSAERDRAIQPVCERGRACSPHRSAVGRSCSGGPRTTDV
ncbi:hypothetical protein BC628DRAFT_1396732, partial [Trametes gibbosa]